MGTVTIFSNHPNQNLEKAAIEKMVAVPIFSAPHSYSSSLPPWERAGVRGNWETAP